MKDASWRRTTARVVFAALLATAGGCGSEPADTSTWCVAGPAPFDRYPGRHALIDRPDALWWEHYGDPDQFDAVGLTHDGQDVGGLIWSESTEAGRTLTYFQPNEPLEPSTEYTAWYGSKERPCEGALHWTPFSTSSVGAPTGLNVHFGGYELETLLRHDVSDMLVVPLFTLQVDGTDAILDLLAMDVWTLEQDLCAEGLTVHGEFDDPVISLRAADVWYRDRRLEEYTLTGTLTETGGLAEVAYRLRVDGRTYGQHDVCDTYGCVPCDDGVEACLQWGRDAVLVPRAGLTPDPTCPS